jgi:ABC-2 type transport system permease protein
MTGEMAVAVSYTQSELRRVLRNPRFLGFSMALPLIMFSAFSASKNGDTLGGLKVAPYIMVSMATFGAMSAVFSTGGRIAMERASGWNRQLRLTALTGPHYVLSKIITGFAMAVPALIAVFIAGAALRGVHLSAERWILAAVSILFALLPIAAFGIYLAYVVNPENMQAITGGVYTLMSLAGGLWIPIENFPTWLADIVRSLPMYWSAGAGRAAIQGDWLGWRGLFTLIAWTAGLGWIAARAFQRDQLRT